MSSTLHVTAKVHGRQSKGLICATFVDQYWAGEETSPPRRDAAYLSAIRAGHYDGQKSIFQLFLGVCYDGSGFMKASGLPRRMN